jgi:5-amino-6-(5-phosphoribosylamino)uracil reductase/diaminohydroxyphosphoribosylaminopyrimidine deaminase/5-amino-6-(5-phosphoribosylamino)uracil reductase
MLADLPAGRGRPTVTLSYAQTLDGRIATAGGSSQWISGPESLRLTHQLRAEHDAIMVGVGTVLADNPRLTVRLVDGPDPLRVIVDSRLRTPLDSNVLAGAAAHGTVLAITASAPGERRQAAQQRGASILVLPEDDAGHVQIAPLLERLAERGVRSVMVEGGAGLITAFLRARLVDRMVVTLAPKVLGRGIDAVGDLEIGDLTNALRLVDVVYERYGDDIVIDGKVVRVEGEDAG